MKKKISLLICLLFCLQGFTQEVPEPIPVDSTPEADSLRNEIKSFIWQNSLQDSAVITRYEQGTEDSYFDRLQNLKNADKITIHLEHGIESTVFVLHPTVYNRLNIPIIYHGGHGGFLWEDTYLNNSGRPYSISVLNFFLAKGFNIVCIDMPLCGVNAGSYIVTEDSSTFVISNHDQLFLLEKPFYYFFEPVRQTLNFLQKEKGVNKFVMIGLSGGGWTTTLYSALDKRITQSYAVAGTIPIPLRVEPSDWGDAEQNYSSFYDRFNFSTLYTLAAAGKNRLHYQILNNNDNCCFDYDGEDYWVSEVQEKVQQISRSGNYKFYYDPHATMHKISSVAVDTIYSNMVNGLLYKNIPFDVKIRDSNQSLTICRNDGPDFSVTLHEGDTVQWSKNNLPIEKAQSSNIKITEAGAYYARVTNISGIQIFSDTLLVKDSNIPAPIITFSNGQLYSSYPGENLWFRNGELLTNVSDNALKPLQPGSYSVIANSDDCNSDPSMSYIYGVTVFADVTNHKINIKLNSTLGKATVELCDMNGRLIIKDTMSTDEKAIYTGTLGKGIYLLKIVSATGVTSKKVFL